MSVPQHDKFFWGVYQDSEEIEDDEEENDNHYPSWYDEPLVEINPYRETWVVYQTFTTIEVDDEGSVPEKTTQEIYPYLDTWQCFQSTTIVYEFEPFQDPLLQFDETLVGRVSLGIILDGGLVGEVYQTIYDSGEFNSEGLIGYTVKKILAEITVYDSLHSQPGNIYEIPEDLGTLETEAEAENPQYLLQDPENNQITNEASTSFVTDSEDVTSDTVVGDGDQDSVSLVISGNSNPSYDKPPGHLLASLSYEMVGSIATITAWSHPNWEDDAPLRKAVETMLNTLPNCIFEVQVEDDPTPFWTSFGFRSAVKGDPVLRLYLSPN